MRNKFSKLVLACLVAFAGIEAFAFNKSMYPYTLPAGAQGAALGCEKAVAGKKLELGKWYTNFTVCKDYADKNGLPLFAVWSNHSCIHCWYTDVVFIQDAFKEWQKTHDAGQVILCYMAGGDDSIDQVGSSAYNWMWNNKSLGAYPFVACWWKKGGVDLHLTGDQLCKGSASANLSFTESTIPQRVTNVTAYLEKAFKGWTATPPYDGGKFVLTDKEDTLKAESTTTTLYVPVVRTGKDATNQTMKIVRGSATGTQTVTWAANVTNQVVAIDSFSSKWYAKGSTVKLQFADAAGTVVSESTVACVADMANSASNPYWLGERTAETLKAGEWTMDLDVALARTKAQAGDAYTLVEFTGALWCPWCRGCENDVLETPEFRQFAKDKNLTLVCLDNLRRNADLDVFATNATAKSVASGPFGAGPTLLRYESGTVNGASVSGISYVSRKMVKSADAEKVLKRNHDLGYIGGAYATPDAYRTGYPTLVLLDKAGTVVGRLNYQADSNTDEEGRHPFDLAENMARLTNLVETASADAVANAYVTTTKLTQSVGLPSSVTLDLNTPSQVLKLTNIPAGAVDFAAQQPRAALSSVTLKLVRLEEVTLQRKDGTKKVVKTEKVKMPVTIASGAGSLKHEFTSADASLAYYLVVSAADGAAKQTVEVSSMPVLTATESVAVYTPVADVIKFDVVKGAVYKFSGAWTDLTTAFTENAEDGTWTAKLTGLIEMEVTPGELVSYQLWKPGTVGFVASSLTVPESIGDVTVKISRTGGTSGAVTARVTVDETKTDLVADGQPRYELVAEDLAWIDGNGDEKSVTVKVTNDRRYDGDGKVVLKLELVSSEGATLGTAEYALTVIEDDEASPGTVGIVTVDPFFSKAQTMYVKESAGATIYVDRLYASDGEASVNVSVTPAGLTVEGVENGKLTWANHDPEPTRTVVIKGLAAGRTAKLTLSNPSKGLKLLPSQATVTIIAMADAVPEFADPANVCTLYRYVTATNVCKLAEAPKGKVSFSKIFGTLPSGLKVSYDAKANALVIGGATSAKPGDYSVVYQVKDGSVVGLTARFDFTVIDPTDTATNPEGANPTVAKPRTFKDVPVINDVTGRLAGTLQLTVPTKGNLSAKYICESGTISLSTKGWSDFDPETKDLHAVLTGKGGFALDATCQTDGTVDLSVTDPTYAGVSLDAEALPQSLWTAKASAADWKGYYTVALPVVTDTVDEDTESLAPRGCGYLTMKMNTSSAWNAGKVTWAGVLPNGTSVSGSTQLTYGSDWAKIPVFKKTTSDTLSVYAKILAKAAEKNEARAVLAVDGVRPCWIHEERDAAAGADYMVDLDAFGGLFRTDISLAACCEESYETTNPVLTAVTDTLGTTALGKPGVVAPASVDVAEKAMKLVSGAPAGMSLSLNRNTGIVTGAVRIPVGEAGKYISAKWSGVILQGWGPGCSDCGPGGSDVFRPFVNGSYFFTDKVSYEVTQSGRTVTKTLSVKRGGELKVE